MHTLTVLLSILWYFLNSASSMNECSTLLYFVKYSIDCPWSLFNVSKRCICLKYLYKLSSMSCSYWLHTKFWRSKKCICLKSFTCLPWVALGSLLCSSIVHYNIYELIRFFKMSSLIFWSSLTSWTDIKKYLITPKNRSSFYECIQF